MPEEFQARPLENMEVGGTLFWDQKAAAHGYSSLRRNAPVATKIAATPTCNGFFALWPSDCVDRHAELDEKMRVLSAQMVIMNSSLTLFTTEPKACDFAYPGISVEQFNASQLLVETGFAETFDKMSTWKKTRFTRISDILRLGLAFKHEKSYLDTDVHFLELRKANYEQTYVGAALWSNLKNAIEITNAAFCLPRTILADMMAFQKSRILQGSDTYFYTELGPSMFHNVLMNRHAVVLLSQNNPAEPSLDLIAKAIHQYGHKQLHLTGHVRKGNAELSFAQIVNTIRKKCGLPLLEVAPAPSSLPPSGGVKEMEK